MRALVVDHIKQVGINILEKYCDVDVQIGISSEELALKIANYDILIGRSTPLTPEIKFPILEKANRLKVIGIASVGLDRCDQNYIRQKGVTLINLPGVNANSVAEHAFAMLLSMIRRIPQANENMKKGNWNKHGYTDALELYRKTMGIIGLGNIGSKTSIIAKFGFQMDVIAYDPYVSEENALKVGAKLVTLDELLVNSDFVIIHAPITEETFHMIGEKELLSMKPRSYILNLGRGNIIDEDALYKVLKSGHLSGAALDVTAEEPLNDSPLLSLPNFLCTPHIAGLTKDALERAAKRVVMESLEMVGINTQLKEKI